MAEHDPTAAEVAAAIATLQAFEAAQHPVAAPVEPVKPSTEPALAEEIPTPIVFAAAANTPASTGAAPTVTSVAIDPYLARSVKSSPNGF